MLCGSRKNIDRLDLTLSISFSLPMSFPMSHPNVCSCACVFVPVLVPVSVHVGHRSAMDGRASVQGSGSDLSSDSGFEPMSAEVDSIAFKAAKCTKQPTSRLKE